MISASSDGSFKKTMGFLEMLKSGKPYSNLSRHGRVGADALRRATPRETGGTAEAWGYEVVHKKNVHYIYWYNTHNENGVNIAAIIQYGHGTKNGGYVPGIDYINPAIRPVQQQAVDDVWKQVMHG